MKITEQTTSKEVKDQTKKTLELLCNTQSTNKTEEDNTARKLFELMRDISSEKYNEYRLKRFKNIISLVKDITGLPEEEILKNMQETITYQGIVEGNECFLYESYPANLGDMIEEWKEKNTPVLSEITEEQIDEAIRRLRDN